MCRDAIDRFERGDGLWPRPSDWIFPTLKDADSLPNNMTHLHLSVGNERQLPTDKRRWVMLFGRESASFNVGKI